MGVLLFRRFCLVIASLFVIGMGSAAIAQEYKFAYSVPYKSPNFSKKPKTEKLGEEIYDDLPASIFTYQILFGPAEK